MKDFIITATSSNCGKTTFTMGLLRALHERNISVQPFKCGPDYIDTMFHHLAANRQSVNLDSFMSSEEHIKSLFCHYGTGADMRVVEGVMGMYDGFDSWHGSSADIARILNIPAVLVVNAKSAAYSVAPLIYGFKNFNKNVNIAGVVFNMVASDKHFAFLEEACRDAGVECLGYMKKNTELNIPGRHLGLTISEKQNMESLISLAAEEVEKHVNIDRILAL